MGLGTHYCDEPFKYGFGVSESEEPESESKLIPISD
jgi:hypothetical protein